MAAEGQKVVLITGCSSGIGLVIAVTLARDEMKRYYGTMRDLKRKDKLVEAAGDTYGKTLSLLTLDVCSDESVKQCVDNIKDRHIDVLINNAGVGLVGPVEGLSMDEMMTVFQTNFFGAVRMIKEVMPDMKKRRSGHIIVISSAMGLQGVVFNDIYSASKFAIEGFCESLAVQLLKFNVTVSMIEPGPVHTEFEMKMFADVSKKEYAGTDPETLHHFRTYYLPSAMNIFQGLGQSPEHIAKCTKKVIESPRPPFRNLTNPLYTPIVALKCADETGSLSVHTFYHLLYNLGGVMNVSLSILKHFALRYSGEIMAAEGQKVVLITGCSSGIGLAIARKDKLVEAAGYAYGKTLSLLALDVCINNAGVGLVGPVEALSLDDMKQVFETNFFGVVRMIKEVMPDMKKRHSGHIIVISSVLGLHGVAFNDVYSASKFATEGLCEGLAIQLMKFNVNVSMIEPGPVNTEFELKLMTEVSKKEYVGADPETLDHFRTCYLPTQVNLFQGLGQTPEDIAKVTKKVIESKRPPFRNLTNPLYTPIVALKYADDTRSLSVHTFYHMLYNLGGVMHVSVRIMKFLSFEWLRRRAISPT
ncbi:Retinol dehydrogenase 8 [Labeo rohita]|uniref:Retinol dehydrogenase 8 n=1 Tax=Labeo rohita TaxID=84645 RepID=A0ABQ8N327_LABRO|nr:Retinol dehydrogenase 8 [Labeo rohita]